MKDRVEELIEERRNLLEKRGQLDTDLARVHADLARALDVSSPASAPAARATPTPRKSTPRKPAASGTPDKRSLKEIVQDILSSNRNGLELKEIVGKVTSMIQRGEYHSKAQNVTPIVQQAIHKLKEDKLIFVEKSPENNHSIYKVA